jgi:hypothetical protein
MEAENARASFAEHCPDCSHGFPHASTIDDEHKEGARIILMWLAEEKEATGKIVGLPTAMRFMEGYPELVDQTTINLLIQFGIDFLFLGGDWLRMAGALAQIAVGLKHWGPSSPHRIGGPISQEETDKLREGDSEAYAALTDLTISDREVILFLGKHITCTCLNEMKKHAKTIPKLGRCQYKECSRNAHEVPNTLDSKMMTCAGCKVFCYCTKDCQVKDWPDHKGFCKREKERNASVLKEPSGKKKGGKKKSGKK